MTHTVISYSREDEAFVRRLEEYLSLHGVKTWIDYRDIPPGTHWRTAIFDAIAASDSVILCLSPSYTQSEMCHMEAFLARSYQKRLFPVMLKSCYELIIQDQVLRGLENLHYLRFDKLVSIGLPVKEDDLLRSLVNTIQGEQKIISEEVVYFAYPGEEATFATRLANDLRKTGIETWIGTRDIVPGLDW